MGKSELTIYQGSLLSLFSSGFPSHIRMNAVDLSSPNGRVFLSPFSGTVERVEKFQLGRPNMRSETDFDFLIMIRVGDVRVKVLHVYPNVAQGERVREGDPIGTFLSTPYTGGDFPHAHIEGVSLLVEDKAEIEDDDPKLRTVVEGDGFIDLEVERPGVIGEVTGVPLGGGLVNGSLPYACYGGLLGEGSHSPIGREVTRRNGMTLFELREGIIENWEYDATFKVLKNEPVCAGPSFEAVLGYGRKPVVRVFTGMKSLTTSDLIYNHLRIYL